MEVTRKVERAILSVGLAVALSCSTSRSTEAPATAPAAAPTPADAERAASSPAPKVDVAALFDRERPPLPAQPIADPKGRWRALLEARSSPRVLAGRAGVVIEADVGTEQPLDCEIYDAQLIPSVALESVLAKASGTVEFLQLTIDRVSAVREVPVLLLSVLYATKQEKRAGELKVALSPRDQYSVLCFQDEPGYRAAFARSVESMLESLETDETPRVPQYSSISKTSAKTSAGDLTTGYHWSRIYAEPDGSMIALDFETALVNISGGEMRLANELRAAVHDRKGIAKANFFGAFGKKAHHEIELQRVSSGNYTYAGKLDGKALSGTFEPKASLSGFYEVLIELAKYTEPGDPIQFQLEGYAPTEGAQQITRMNYSLAAARDQLTLTDDAGRHVSWTLLDGLPTGSQNTLGQSSFTRTSLVRRSALGSAPGVSLGVVAPSEPAPPLALAEKRRAFATAVFAQSDRTAAVTPPPKLLSLVRYTAPLGENVAYVSPPRRGPKRPAILWIGGVFDWRIGDTAWKPAARANDQSARAFREAGLVLMLPALRGSHDNPGKNECFLGEVDDIIAAADFLARREDVDPTRIYLGGHGTGATLALLAAASTERFRAIFAFGPVADVRQYGGPAEGGCLPADIAVAEAALRAPIEHMSTIRTPTFVIEGARSGNVGIFEALRERASRRVHFSIVPGADHFSVLAPGTEVIAQAILSDRVDDSHLLIEVDPAP